MVLTTYFNDLRAQGVEKGQAALRSAKTRLRPVLMTALVASVGFVPMALSTIKARKLQRPFATVVIFGILHLDRFDAANYSTLTGWAGGLETVKSCSRIVVLTQIGSQNSFRSGFFPAEFKIGLPVKTGLTANFLRCPILSDDLCLLFIVDIHVNPECIDALSRRRPSPMGGKAFLNRALSALISFNNSMIPRVLSWWRFIANPRRSCATGKRRHYQSLARCRCADDGRTARWREICSDFPEAP